VRDARLKDGAAGLLYGAAPVLAALRAGRRAAHTLYVQEGSGAEEALALHELVRRRVQRRAVAALRGSGKNGAKNDDDDESAAELAAAVAAVRRSRAPKPGTPGAKAGDAGTGAALAEAVALATRRGARVEVLSRAEVGALTEGRPSQGMLLDCGPLEWAPLDALPDPEELKRAAQEAEAGVGTAAAAAAAPHRPRRRRVVWLALDEVVDPQNLGAVVRSAHCLGAAAVLACGRNCAPLSAAASKASAGALEGAALFSCRSLPRTLEDAAERGWHVLGASAEGVPIGEWAARQRSAVVAAARAAKALVVAGDGAAEAEAEATKRRGRKSKKAAAAEEEQQLQNALDDESLLEDDTPVVLVVGSEGSGLRTNVRRACTELVRVEMAAAPAAVVASRRRAALLAAAGGEGRGGGEEGEDEASSSSVPKVEVAAAAAQSDGGWAARAAARAYGKGGGDGSDEEDEEDEAWGKDEEDGGGGIGGGVAAATTAYAAEVDSLNVSVATGVLLHALLFPPPPL
jgi:21S rRNA (GM2251-2'-O)-methyltransferase